MHGAAKIFTRLDEEYFNIRDFISKFLVEIHRNENLPLQRYFAVVSVFSAVVFTIIYDLLSFIITNQKLKMMLLIMCLK